MKRYQVYLTDRAVRQLNEAANWIAEHDPQAANSWFNSAVAKIQSLRESPSRCGVARESKNLPIEVRELLLGKKRTWRVLFTVRESIVTIMALRHVARNDATITDLIGPGDEDQAS